jgi:hypothetical protein
MEVQDSRVSRHHGLPRLGESGAFATRPFRIEAGTDQGSGRRADYWMRRATARFGSEWGEPVDRSARFVRRDWWRSAPPQALPAPCSAR